MNKYIKGRAADLYFAVAAIWCVLGFFLHLLLLRLLIREGEWLTVICTGAIWWAITLTVEYIRRRIVKRLRAKEEAQQREYREQYVTEIAVEDESFGRVVLERDSKSDTIGVEEYPLEKPLGRHGEVLLTAEIDGCDAARIASVLTYLYRNSRDILEMMYRHTLECCENYEECDSDGKPYDIDYVRNNLELYGVAIVDGSDSVYLSLDGSISGDDGEELLGCHGITLDVELTKDDKPRRKRMTCGLVG